MGRRPIHLKNLSLHNPSTQPFYTTLGTEARQPSHRRCVQERSRIRGSRAAANHQNANQALWHRKVNPNAGIHLFPTFFGLLSGLAETFGGIFILLGLFYRPMALFLVGDLMMAGFIELAPGAPLLQVSRPFEEGVFYLGVVFAGPGRYSLDHLLRNEVGEEEHNPF